MTGDQLWTDVCSVLELRRPRGWRLEEELSEWHFGLGGSSLMVASVEDGTDAALTVYMCDNDAELQFSDTRALVESLAALEERHRGLTGLQKRIIASDDPLNGAGLNALQAELAAQDQAFDG